MNVPHEADTTTADNAGGQPAPAPQQPLPAPQQPPPAPQHGLPAPNHPPRGAVEHTGREAPNEANLTMAPQVHQPPVTIEEPLLSLVTRDDPDAISTQQPVLAKRSEIAMPDNAGILFSRAALKRNRQEQALDARAVRARQEKLNAMSALTGQVDGSAELMEREVNKINVKGALLRKQMNFFKAETTRAKQCEAIIKKESGEPFKSVVMEHIGLYPTEETKLRLAFVMNHSYDDLLGRRSEAHAFCHKLADAAIATGKEVDLARVDLNRIAKDIPEDNLSPPEPLESSDDIDTFLDLINISLYEMRARQNGGANNVNDDGIDNGNNDGNDDGIDNVNDDGIDNGIDNGINNGIDNVNDDGIDNGNNDGIDNDNINGNNNGNNGSNSNNNTNVNRG